VTTSDYAEDDGVRATGAGPAGRFPPMPLEAWVDSKETLHRLLQIVGKVRLASAPPRNHWWNVPFHLTGRGITTRPMGTDPIFAIDFDFVDHRLVINTVDGRTEWFSLPGNSVAAFYERILSILGGLGIELIIDRPEPFDLVDPIPFAEDTVHTTYDPMLVDRYWQILSEVNLLLEEFAGQFSGKTSPVHHFWHTQDNAVTRFSDREVEHPSTVDSVTREAYSREVISSGFWFGDHTFPERLSIPTPPQSRKGCPPNPSGPQRPNGFSAATATWQYSGTTTPAPWTSQDQPSSSS
jgi:hypothetical protein